MKLSLAFLAASVTASVDQERAFVDNQDFIAVGTEEWWVKGVEKGWFDPETYIQEIVFRHSAVV